MEKIGAFASILHKHKLVGIDSSIFIYSFEQHPQFEKLSSLVFESLSSGALHLITSVISVSEIMVRPFQIKNIAAIQAYESAFTTMPHFTLASIDFEIAKIASLLRAENNILLPDALQLATALKYKATLFVTNDARLKKVKDIAVVCLHDYL